MYASHPKTLRWSTLGFCPSHAAYGVFPITAFDGQWLLRYTAVETDSANSGELRPRSSKLPH